MTLPVIHRVSALDLGLRPHAWPFADERRAEIDAHFAIKSSEKPIWNGRILLARDPVFIQDRFSACYFEARSEEHTSELQSRLLISYAVFCLKKKK